MRALLLPPTFVRSLESQSCAVRPTILIRHRAQNTRFTSGYFWEVTNGNDIRKHTASPCRAICVVEVIFGMPRSWPCGFSEQLSKNSQLVGESLYIWQPKPRPVG